MSGEIGRIIDVWQNQDFYGTEVFDPNDPFYKKATDAMLHLAPLPFAVSSALSFRSGGAPLSKQALGFFGFTKAPGYINQAEIQTKIFDLFQKRMGQGVKTKEDAQIAQQKSDIKKAYQNGDSVKANQLLDAAVKSGAISAKGVSTFIKNADLPGDIRAFRSLPSSDQQALVKDMTPEELNKYGWYVNSDIRGDFSKLSPDAKDFVDKVKSGELTQPKYKAGAIVDGTKPSFTSGQKTTETSLIGRISAYAQAIGTDPVTAFHDIMAGQTIRKTVNGAIIVERMPASESGAIKHNMGGDKTMELDHVIPLSLGGTNEASNLKLVPMEKAAEADKLEKQLAKQLSDGTITKQEAQKQILDFKNNQ
jgi:hypothetical protein